MEGAAVHLRDGGEIGHYASGWRAAVADPGFHEITGLAWSGRGLIRRVDVSTDGGTSWKTAALQEPVLPKCLTRFRLPWTWDGGPALLQSRAVDQTGYVQPPREVLLDVRGVNSHYHFNAQQTWRIAPSGVRYQCGLSGSRWPPWWL